LRRVFREARRGCLGIVEEWEGGVGGLAGMKREGMDATDAC